MKRPILVAHRGFSAVAPENTFAAFDAALKYGCRDIECDVQLSADGIPVLMHDDTVDRTTNGTGRVQNLRLHRLRHLDAGSWFGHVFIGQKIPTLREVLLRYKHRARLHIELKEGQSMLPDAVVADLYATGWLDADNQVKRSSKDAPQLIISSFDRSLLQRSIMLLPRDVVHELLVEQVSHESLVWAARVGAHSYLPDGALITPQLVRKAKRYGLNIGAWWWSRDEQDALALAQAGGRFAFVDSPQEAARMLAWYSRWQSFQFSSGAKSNSARAHAPL